LTRGNVPPQAFSQSELANAMKWLANQPDYVRNLAATPEGLINLYRKNYKAVDMDNNTPVSGESFRQELQDIAQKLGSFSDELPTPPRFDSYSSQVSPLSASANWEEEAEPVGISKEGIAQALQKQMQNADPIGTRMYSQSGAKASILDSFDSLSKSRVQEVQSRFNLSSEDEALRILISLGFEKFQKLL
jgi:hypothetical protein